MIITKEEKEADRIVDMYSKTFRDQGAQNYADSINECAIIYINGIIKAIRGCSSGKFEFYQKVKEILENRWKKQY